MTLKTPTAPASRDQVNGARYPEPGVKSAKDSAAVFASNALLEMTPVNSKPARPTTLTPWADASPARVASMAELLEMLTYKRPADSESESEFIARFIDVLGAESDGYGNRWLDVGDGESGVLWTAHTDTVHHKGGRQRVDVDSSGFAFVPRKQKPKTNCLGADDTAGVWLLCEMIRAGVPGRYAFFRGEECGGLGSNYVIRQEPGRLDGIRFAIALDRKGYDSVITEQGGRRTASHAFAISLAKALATGGAPGFQPDDTGVFTDTEVLADIVPECSNLSVGYFMQHGPQESLDLPFVERMRDALCLADFSGLVESRDPEAGFWSGGDSFSGAYGDGFARRWAPKGASLSRVSHGDLADLIEFVGDNPATVAAMLAADGYSLRDLEDFAAWNDFR